MRLPTFEDFQIIHQELIMSEIAHLNIHGQQGHTLTP